VFRPGSENREGPGGEDAGRNSVWGSRGHA
jgi:hypothetical protein